MSGVGQKASGIGQHTDKVTQQPKVGKRGHLLLHPRFVIDKPPGGTLLDLADGIGILETAKDTADRFIVVGIQAVNNGFRKAGRHIERIQEICHLAGGRVIIDAVISRIRSK